LRGGLKILEKKLYKILKEKNKKKQYGKSISLKKLLPSFLTQNRAVLIARGTRAIKPHVHKCEVAVRASAQTQVFVNGLKQPSSISQKF
jgi:hypothetical protein